MKPNINSVEVHPLSGWCAGGHCVFTMAPRSVQTDKMDEVQGTMNMAQ